MVRTKNSSSKRCFVQDISWNASKELSAMQGRGPGKQSEQVWACVCVLAKRRSWKCWEDEGEGEEDLPDLLSKQIQQAVIRKLALIPKREGQRPPGCFAKPSAHRDCIPAAMAYKG